MPPPDAEIRHRLILDALRERAAEVARRLAPDSSPATDGPTADDPEEALRLVMVRLWPAFSAARSSGAALESLAAGLHGLREAARGEDWRFLDAWNNAYESIAVDEAIVSTAPAQALLATYAQLLDHHIQRLAR
jgi:hypothetical protein